MDNHPLVYDNINKALLSSLQNELLSEDITLGYICAFTFHLKLFNIPGIKPVLEISFSPITLVIYKISSLDSSNNPQPLVLNIH